MSLRSQSRSRRRGQNELHLIVAAQVELPVQSASLARIYVAR